MSCLEKHATMRILCFLLKFHSKPSPHISLLILQSFQSQNLKCQDFSPVCCILVLMLGHTESSVFFLMINLSKEVQKEKKILLIFFVFSIFYSFSWRFKLIDCISHSILLSILNNCQKRASRYSILYCNI